MNLKKQFRQSLKCGTGEAYLIAKANPDIDFSSDIKKAALTNYAYDPQCEGDRAFYVAGLIELSPRKEQLVETVIEALGKEREDCWALDQLFALAAVFAKQGNLKAKKAIYKRFHKKVIKYSEWLGEQQILEVDGLEGLKYIAAVKGKAFTKNPDDWDDGFLIDCFQEENPDIKAHKELKKAASGNPFIHIYLDNIERVKRLRAKNQKRPPFNYQFVKERIENNIRVPAPPAVARKLTKADMKKLANDFLQVKDPKKIEAYLSVFSQKEYPYDYQILLEIAKGKNNRNSRSIELACESLHFFKAKDIRQFAIEKLIQTNRPEYYLRLLVRNYKASDHRLLCKIAETFKNEHRIHNLVWGYIDIFKANNTKQCKQPLEILYRKLTCGIHRYDILEILRENEVLSRRILKEMEFDSYDDIRELYTKISKKN